MICCFRPETSSDLTVCEALVLISFGISGGSSPSHLEIDLGLGYPKSSDVNLLLTGNSKLTGNLVLTGTGDLELTGEE